MAITKLGAKLMALEKRAFFGSGGKPSPQPAQPQGPGLKGRIASFAFPAMMAFGPAQSIFSGEQSIGGGLGELAGGMAGWSLGDRVGRSLTRNIKSKFLKGPLQFVSTVGLGLAGSMLAGGIGAGVGNAIIPYRRKTPALNNWWDNADNGWNGQPGAY